ncbi:hypothetical protein PENSPDRAFT_405107 [Peniophora sp. CONT]|nr:hypothetical protein PENSPDRAFT_405107 [Peniophora sp. CONT]
MEDQLLVEKEGKQPSEKVQPKAKPSRKGRSEQAPANVVDLALVIIALDALLNSKVLNIIITPPLAAHIDNEYQGTKQRDFGQDTEGSGTGQDAESLQVAESSVSQQLLSLDEAGTEGAVDREPDDDKEAVENPRQHVVRYLKTLTTQYNAVKKLVYRRSGTPSSKLVTYMFNIAPPVLNVDDADISQFKTKFLKMFARPGSLDYLASNAFLATVNRRADDVRGKTAAVHTEAFLMGLACASVFHFEPHLEEDQLKVAATVFAVSLYDSIILCKTLHSLCLQTDPAEAIPIGVSKKCCLCCSLLADLLAKRGTKTTARPQFVLPGTHATIFPWAAPSIGVPLDVLKDMRTQLLQILHEIAISTKDLPQSHQTSPAPSTSSLASNEIELDEHLIIVNKWKSEFRPLHRQSILTGGIVLKRK